MLSQARSDARRDGDIEKVRALDRELAEAYEQKRGAGLAHKDHAPDEYKRRISIARIEDRLEKEAAP